MQLNCAEVATNKAGDAPPPPELLGGEHEGPHARARAAAAALD